MKYAAAYLLVRNACATYCPADPNARGLESESAMCFDVPTVGGVLARGCRESGRGILAMRTLLRLSRRTLDVVRTHATRASSARTPEFVFPRIRVFR